MTRDKIFQFTIIQFLKVEQTSREHVFQLTRRKPMVFFLGGNIYFRGNRFSDFLGDLHLGEILSLTFLGEIALGKIFETRKIGGNELGEMLTKIFP